MSKWRRVIEHTFGRDTAALYVEGDITQIGFVRPSHADLIVAALNAFDAPPLAGAVKGEGFERTIGGFAFIHVGSRLFTADQVRAALARYSP